jgi:pimeloyl-ACP methyl ester carboxylesterase
MIQVGMALLAASLSYKPPVTIDLPAAPGSAQHIALHCATPQGVTHKGVLFVHGATFPTMLAFGFEFQPGDSWIDFMAKRGYLSCGLDFLGYGASSRPQALFESPTGKPPLLRAPEAAREIAIAISYMRDRRGIKEMHVVAHSWGTIAAATFAARHPGALTSLTLFGPVVPTPGSTPNSEHAAWYGMTAQERLRALYFSDVVPHGAVFLEPAVTSRWAHDFTASAPHVTGDPVGMIRIPDDPIADSEDAQAGIYPYDPRRITTPIFAVFANYDVYANDVDTPPFLARFSSSPLKWQLCIHSGTHVIHLERNRMSLYESVLGFIRAAASLGIRGPTS